MKPARLRRLWRAVAHPVAFFEDLPDQPNLGAAARPALLSVAVGASVLALAVAKATASGAWLSIGLIVVPGVTLYATALWLAGGLTLARAAEIDHRGWEIAAWAWLPTGFLALVLLPVVAVFPVTSLLLGTLGLPVWHLLVVVAGLQVFTGRRPGRVVLYYALVVLALPITAMALGALALLGGAGGG